MALPDDDELRRMAEAIDAGLEPRVRLELDLSADGARRLHDILAAVAADFGPRAGIEGTWPVIRALAALDAALAE